MDIAAPRPTRLIELVDRLDVFTEDDLVLLTDALPSTLAAWRRRGEGPAYIVAAKKVLYPRTAVAEWLKTRTRERRAVPVSQML